jgi:hypothetical protein
MNEPIADCSGRNLVPSRPTENEVSKRFDCDVALALQRIEEAKRGGTFYTTREVLDHLR